MSKNQTTAHIAVSQMTGADYTLPLNEMIIKVKNEPKPEFIYSGIKEGSVGIVFGPSKSGKTIFCENLGMAIAAQLPDFLGLPLKVRNPKVLVISFEEHYTNRTMRNIQQAEKLKAAKGESWMTNYLVAKEEMPRYISTSEHWNLLADIINKHSPGIVILDSITRMCQGIEESAVAQQFMKNLRHLSLVTGTTIMPIHHTHKMYGQPISMDTIAGSRVLPQEIDFAIGINKTQDGKRYIKDVFFRYAPDDKETVTTFTIDDKCWLNVTGETNESNLLAAPDGRRDSSRSDKIVAYLTEKMGTETPTAGAGELEARFVPGEMSRTALFEWLKKLMAAGKITETDGQYRVAG